jgi:peptidyl-prolyl isomerase D
VPTAPIVIADCGEITDLSELENAETTDSEDPYEDFPEDEDRNTEDPQVALTIAKALKDLGGKLFKEGKQIDALNKWESKYLQVIINMTQTMNRV